MQHDQCSCYTLYSHWSWHGTECSRRNKRTGVDVNIRPQKTSVCVMKQRFDSETGMSYLHHLLPLLHITVGCKSVLDKTGSVPSMSSFQHTLQAWKSWHVIERCDRQPTEIWKGRGLQIWTSVLVGIISTSSIYCTAAHVSLHMSLVKAASSISICLWGVAQICRYQLASVAVIYKACRATCTWQTGLTWWKCIVIAKCDMQTVHNAARWR